MINLKTKLKNKQKLSRKGPTGQEYKVVPKMNHYLTNGQIMEEINGLKLIEINKLLIFVFSLFQSKLKNLKNLKNIKETKKEEKAALLDCWSQFFYLFFSLHFFCPKKICDCGVRGEVRRFISRCSCNDCLQLLAKIWIFQVLGLELL